MAYHRFRPRATVKNGRPRYSRFAIRVVRSERSVDGADAFWLSTLRGKIVTFANIEEALAEVDKRKRHVNSPYVTYYVDQAPRPS